MQCCNCVSSVSLSIRSRNVTDCRISDVPQALGPLQQVFILKTAVKVSLAACASITPHSVESLVLFLSPLLTPRMCICVCCGSSCFKTLAELTGVEEEEEEKEEKDKTQIGLDVTGNTDSKTNR